MALETATVPNSTYNELNINYFKDKFLYGHRAHHFHVGIQFPEVVATGNGEYFTLYAKDSQIPPSQLEMVEVSWHGMKIALAKDRTNSGTFDINFHYDDNSENEASKIRLLFEKWSDAIVSVKSNGENLRTYPHQYKGLIQTIQWQLNQKTIDQWIYAGVWPEKVGEMTQAHETGDIMSYAVTFRYDFNYSVEISRNGFTNFPAQN